MRERETKIKSYQHLESNQSFIQLDEEDVSSVRLVQQFLFPINPVYHYSPVINFRKVIYIDYASID